MRTIGPVHGLSEVRSGGVGLEIERVLTARILKIFRSFRARFCLRSRNPLDRIANSEVRSTLQPTLATNNTDHRPNSSLEQSLFGQNPLDRTSGQSWPIPIIDILQMTLERHTPKQNTNNRNIGGRYEEEKRKERKNRKKSRRGVLEPHRPTGRGCSATLRRVPRGSAGPHETPRGSTMPWGLRKAPRGFAKAVARPCEAPQGSARPRKASRVALRRALPPAVPVESPWACHLGIAPWSEPGWSDRCGDGVPRELGSHMVQAPGQGSRKRYFVLLNVRSEKAPRGPRGFPNVLAEAPGFDFAESLARPREAWHREASRGFAEASRQGPTRPCDGPARLGLRCLGGRARLRERLRGFAKGPEVPQGLTRPRDCLRCPARPAKWRNFEIMPWTRASGVKSCLAGLLPPSEVHRFRFISQSPSGGPSGGEESGIL